MPSPPADRRPLAGRTLDVPSTGAAGGWAAWLLAELGATVPGAPDDTVALTDGVTEDWAGSGLVALTGRRDGPPVVPPGLAASAARGAALALDRVAGLAGLRPPGVPGHQLLGERAALVGLRRRGPSSPGGGCRLLPAADGWVAMTLARPDDRAAVPALTGSPRGCGWAAVRRWLRGQDAAGAVERAQLLGLAAAVVPRPDAPPDDQLAARGGCRPARISVTTPGPARRLGERPLVLDLSSLWAGPLCAHLLGLAGARVVKVESSARPDGTRGGPPEFYRLLHAGQESIAVDLRGSGGRALLRDLLGRADVVIESSRPRVMEQFGIVVPDLLAESPTVWVSITAYGRAGPWAHRVGYGDDTAAAAGLAVGDPGGRGLLPCGDALADPLAGLHAAAAAMACWVAGGSALVDVALRDVARATVPTSAAGAPVRRQRRGWIIDGPDGPVPVRPPVARPVSGRTHGLGADTRRLLAELGVRR
jgi:crotonobetainyl-CoA:carnitine CoA-transferase CaiB-like acyl-CoA transferase